MQYAMGLTIQAEDARGIDTATERNKIKIQAWYCDCPSFLFPQTHSTVLPLPIVLLIPIVLLLTTVSALPLVILSHTSQLIAL